MSIGLLRPERGDELRRLGGLPSTRKGAIVARKRPTVSDVPQIPASPEASRPARDQHGGVDGLSHAQVHALRRCTPLTSAEFKAHREARASYDQPTHFHLALRGVRLREEANRVNG